MRKNFRKRSMFSKVTSAVVATTVVASTIAIVPSIAEKMNGDLVAGDKQAQYELLDNIQDASILHCWNWSYKTIEDNLELIAQCGYSAIQTSPAQQPKDYAYKGVVGTDVGTPSKGGTGNWWKLYQPVGFNVCDNGNSWLGTKAELESLCEKAEEYGIKVVVDIVANHLGNISGWKNKLSDVTPQVGEFFLADMLTDETYWHINEHQVWMSDSRLHFTQGSMGMPDLNTGDKRVQQMVATYLDELIDCGVDGFRFDAAKHIETPDDDPSFASDFWPTVLNEAKSHYKSTNNGNDLYVYGEVLNTVGDNFSIDSYTKYMSVTDNSAGNHLLEAFRNNNIGTLNMDYDAKKSVLWAESHDTYMNESSIYASDKSIVRTWSMIANKDNAAKLFFVRPYYSSEILNNDQDGSMKGNLENTLVQAQMGACETYTWASKEVAAINHFNNRFANRTENYGVDGNAAYVRRGNGIIITNFSGAGHISMNAHGMADGVYQDEVSRNIFFVTNGQITGDITSDAGIAVIYENVMDNPDEDYPVQIKNSVGDNTTYYSDELKVTLNALYAKEASYKTSAGENGAFTGETTVSIGKGLRKGDKLTLTVTASNKKGATTQIYTYTKDEYDLTNCIFFKDTNNWGSVTAYAWNDSSKTGGKNGAWPGVEMYECDTVNHIFACKIDPDAGYTKIIFSKNGSSQTKDLNIGSIGYCYDASTGKWSEYKKTTPVYKPIVSTDTESKNFNGSLTVKFTATNADNATITVNGVSESFAGTVTKTFTDTSNVKVTATKGNDKVEKTYTYTRTFQLPVITLTDSKDFCDSIDVTITASGASESYYQINNGKKVAFDTSKTLTLGSELKAFETVTVTVYASNSDGEATPIKATYTKFDEPMVETTKLYINTNKCSWFTNDKAVAAITVDGSSKYVEMTAFTNNAGETIYTYDIPSTAKNITVGRMLPSGDVYNTRKITLKAGMNYYVANNNLSSYTASVFNDTPIEKTPIITVDKTSGTYTSSVTVTITVDNAKEASYTLNGSVVAFKGSTSITLNQSTSIEVVAKNEMLSAKQTYTYIIEDEPVIETVDVYFTNNNNWKNVYVYYWGSKISKVDWPGAKMTYVGKNEYNQSIYKFNVPNDVKGIIFTNGNGAQTEDITTGIIQKAGFYIKGANGAKLSVGSYIYK